VRIVLPLPNANSGELLDKIESNFHRNRRAFASKPNAARQLFLGFHDVGSCVTQTTFWGIPMSKVIAFLKNESGATAIEYGLIAAGISVAIIAVVNGLGTQLNTTFTSVSSQLR
jgi:pilus assembly protein Flp/PilA